MVLIKEVHLNHIHLPTVTKNVQGDPKVTFVWDTLYLYIAFEETFAISLLLSPMESLISWMITEIHFDIKHPQCIRGTWVNMKLLSLKY